MIRLNDICFAYEEKVVLSHFNLTVAEGEMVVIKGDNGCGKSTLLNIMNALDFADKGSYMFCGEEISRRTMKNSTFAKSFHRRIGYVFQNTDAQLFCSTVEDELAFAPNQMGLSREKVQSRVDDVITMMELNELRHRAPFNLSMGEKKKVAIASVLTANPQVLVLDEPMNFLDKASRLWIKDFLTDMKRVGKTIIIVSHTDDFDLTADRIIEM